MSKKRKKTGLVGFGDVAETEIEEEQEKEDQETVDEKVDEIDSKEEQGSKEDDFRAERRRRLQGLREGKQRLEDTHRRRTFLIRNDLLDRFDKYAETAENISFKTDFINLIIEEALDDVEGKE